MTLRTMLFFFNDTATTEIYTLSLHDALPIFPTQGKSSSVSVMPKFDGLKKCWGAPPTRARKSALEAIAAAARSEEHTSELQSRQYLVCRLLLEKKKIVRTSSE